MAVVAGTLGYTEPASPNKKADANTVTRSAVVVQREMVSIGSPNDATPEQIADCPVAAPASGDAGLAVRLVPQAATEVAKVAQGTAAAASGAWPTKGTDAAGVNQQAITAAGDTKVTLDGEAVVLGAGAAKVGAVDLDSDATPAAAVPATAQYVAGTDGTNARGLKTDAAGELQVDVLTLPTASVQGLAAHDAAASGNPVLLAGQMETPADSAPGTRAGTDGDVVTRAAIDGAAYMVPGGPQQWAYHENSSSALTDASVHAAPGAGLSLYVTTIIVSTGAATAFNIFFEEATTTVLGPYYLEAVAGRGFVITFAVPKKITANTALTVTTSAAIAHSIDITGFIAPG